LGADERKEPKTVPQAIEQAVRFHQEGRLGEAERLYREALRASPRNFEALHLLGALKLQQGEAAEAERLIGAALDVAGPGGRAAPA